MERIKITEIDNTSNVEALSSYDVVYVPGFVNTETANNVNFRNPVLVTSRYQFTQTFGDKVPRFPAAQVYPEASGTKKGFPAYAIPNYKKLIISDERMNLHSYDEIELVQTYFVHEDIVAAAGEEDWIPEEGRNYFLLTGVDGAWEVDYSTLPLEAGETYVSKYGAEGTDNVYSSRISPAAYGWYEMTTGGYVETADIQIGVDATTVDGFKSYYRVTQEQTAMFAANDPDPGYRYALYLLSLGIPVYFEQMNTGTDFDEVDLHEDWKTCLMKYGRVDAEGVTYISPAENEWFIRNTQGVLVRYKDANPNEPLRFVNEEDVDNTYYIGADISLESMYKGLENRFMQDPETPDYSFDSMGDYSIKYITSGGYPTFEYGITDDNNEVVSGLAEAMIQLSSVRGDSLALIDHTNNPERSVYETEASSVIASVRDKFQNIDPTVASFGAMFTPWYSCTHAVIQGPSGAGYSDQATYMPASLAFLSALATQLRNYNPWLAVSGVTRGKIPYFGSLHTNQPITNNVADSYQSVPNAYTSVQSDSLISINPITYIRQYGFCIWGNRTLRNNKSGTKAASFLNIRNLVSDIKKTLYEASQQLMFEQNTDVLWINFKHLITPLLDTMVSNYILSDYRLVKYNVDPETGEPVPAYMILANIEIRPINSVEVFNLTVTLENSEIAVAEVE